jgi:hypothetical protein
MSCVVTLTTVPERLSHPSTRVNLQRLRDQSECRLILNVPYVYARTGEDYVIPASISNIAGLEINRCADTGPSTKLLPTLHNPTVANDAIIVVVDDDIVYKDKHVQYLLEAVQRNPNAIHGYEIEPYGLAGYAGWAARKKLIQPIVSVPMPQQCAMVDDDYWDTVAKARHIPIKVVAYEGNSSNGFSGIATHLGTPAWFELHKHTDRHKLSAECRLALSTITTEKPS